MSTATARMTLGGILGTVNDVTSTVSSVFNTTTKSINMLNKYVTDAAEKQSIRSTLDMHDFTQKLAEEKAMEATQRKIQIYEFINSSEMNKNIYEKEYLRIEELLLERKTII